ncbi:heparinase II/III family protein [Olivibacter sp. SDN3]|uniref:heparinase II/III domain-containing protein n=1 Tax=Olivibacter sp. SDN3 TaxID=2764720 RepID=UPI001651A19D|nr:heparinase II/III family protein [Olivibacter sp. SDN3]QNL49580.1 heparinase II/III family protein [Olivibacter sp. SDN3]
MKYILATCLLFQIAIAAEKRDLLIKTFPLEAVASHLANAQEWVDFPAYNNREFWDSQPVEIKTDLIKRGEKALSFDWAVIKATDYLELGRSGSRDRMQQPDNARKNALKALLMAELVDGKGRFLDQIINGVWAICEQSNWVLSAHLGLQKKDIELPDVNNMVIDLGSGETGALLSWIHYFMKDRLDEVSPLIAQRIAHEVRRNILDPYYNRSDLWWMGLGGEKSNNARGLVNNWNPWINYNVLQCILLMETDPDKRVQYTCKTMQSVDQFINSYNDDGACDEGPSYWSHAGGKFFEYLELLAQATQGKVAIYNHPLVKNIGTYIYQVYIDDPYFVNFADASAKGGVNAGLVYRYGEAIGDATMKGFGSFYAQKKGLDKTLANASVAAMINDLLWMPRIMQDKPIEPLVGYYWFPQTQVAGAREHPNAKSGFYFAAKGGHNDEFHNHNDVGTFILYYNGLPCLVDAGVGTYTKQTFSSERYKIWTMQSGNHNLPLVNGFEQPHGLTYRAKHTSFKVRPNPQFSVDIADAYPKEAAVKYWQRTYELNKKRGFVIQDQFELEEFNAANAIHFLSPCNIKLVKTGLLELELGEETVYMQYDAELFTDPKIEKISIDDPRLLASWPEGLYKIAFTAKTTDKKGRYVFTVKKTE